MRLWRRGDRRGTTANGPMGGTDLVDEVDGPDGAADRLVDEDLEPPAGIPTQGGAGGPVLLTLTTREQIEQAAAVEAAPKVVRVRPGRGAFGGVASGGGCGPGCAH